MPLHAIAGPVIVHACLGGVPAAAAGAAPDAAAREPPCSVVAEPPCAPRDGPGPPVGDRASYATWNADGDRWVYGVELRDVATGRLLATSARIPPWTPGAPGWRGHGAAYLPSDGVRIPDRVSIRWWHDLDAARRRDPASRQGPHVIELRGRIGERALAAVAGGAPRFMLEIGVGAGRVPPVLRWHLLDRLADPPGSVTERGGDEIDWRPTSWR